MSYIELSHEPKIIKLLLEILIQELMGIEPTGTLLQLHKFIHINTEDNY